MSTQNPLSAETLQAYLYANQKVSRIERLIDRAYTLHPEWVTGESCELQEPWRVEIGRLASDASAYLQDKKSLIEVSSDLDDVVEGVQEKKPLHRIEDDIDRARRTVSFFGHEHGL
jgi:hypothetical protein